MTPLSYITDMDIFGVPEPDPLSLVVRRTVKGFVFDGEGNIALVGGDRRKLFPGGGVEEGETDEEAFKRECLEEVGVSVHIREEFGEAIQDRYKTGKKYEIVFFIADVIGEKDVKTTTQEDESTMSVYWVNENDVIKILKENMSSLTEGVYVPHFNCSTALAVWSVYQNQEK